MEISPEPARRDTVRRAFRQENPSMYRTDLWKFASQTELTPEMFVHGSVFYRADDQPPELLIRV